MKKQFVFEVKEIRDTSRGFVHRFVEVDGEGVSAAAFGLTTEQASELKRGDRVSVKLEILPRS